MDLKPPTDEELYRFRVENGLIREPKPKPEPPPAEEAKEVEPKPKPQRQPGAISPAYVPLSMQSQSDNTMFLKNALAMVGWQKPNMADPDEVQKRVADYFQLCSENDVRPSVEGLALAFCVSRQTLLVWANKVSSPKIPKASHDLIRRAYQILNVLMADYMQNGKIHPVAGIFLMKNNMGYTDQRQLQISASPYPEDAEASPEELREKYLEAIDVEATEVDTETP